MSRFSNPSNPSGTATHQTTSLPSLVVRLIDALSEKQLERVLGLLGEDEFIPGGVTWEAREERGAEMGKRVRYKGHAEIGGGFQAGDGRAQSSDASFPWNHRNPQNT